MHRVWRAAVYLVTFAIPVVIAACYGPSFKYRKGGKVLDKATRAPISQIEVTCEKDGGYSYPESTTADGTFNLQYNEPCDDVKAVDQLGGPGDAGTLGADAGLDDAGMRKARYQTKTVPFDNSAADLTIELDRSN